MCAGSECVCVLQLVWSDGGGDVTGGGAAETGSKEDGLRHEDANG